MPAIKARDIAAIEGIAAFALADDIADAANPRRHHRQPGRHGFDHHQPEGLQPRGEDENIRAGISLGQALPLQVAHECHWQAGEVPLQARPRRTVADQDQTRARQLLQSGPDVLDLLLRGQPPDIEQQRLLAVILGHFPAHGGRAKARMKGSGIDAPPPQSYLSDAQLPHLPLNQFRWRQAVIRPIEDGSRQPIDQGSRETEIDRTQLDWGARRA